MKKWHSAQPHRETAEPGVHEVVPRLARPRWTQRSASRLPAHENSQACMPEPPNSCWRECSLGQRPGSLSRYLHSLWSIAAASARSSASGARHASRCATTSMAALLASRSRRRAAPASADACSGAVDAASLEPVAHASKSQAESGTAPTAAVSFGELPCRNRARPLRFRSSPRIHHSIASTCSSATSWNSSEVIPSTRELKSAFPLTWPIGSNMAGKGETVGGGECTRYWNRRKNSSMF
mmetsp:Transcript_57458/g.135235  ORF Transcript_57458/g.135235 Transcript_57458/m.135235 type:complete len:239 (+) Transcript_57458:416-1132(+)